MWFQSSSFLRRMACSNYFLVFLVFSSIVGSVPRPAVSHWYILVEGVSCSSPFSFFNILPDAMFMSSVFVKFSGSIGNICLWKYLFMKVSICMVVVLVILQVS